MVTMAIPDNGLQPYHTSFAVRSAIVATAQLLIVITAIKLDIR